VRSSDEGHEARAERSAFAGGEGVGAIVDEGVGVAVEEQRRQRHVTVEARREEAGRTGDVDSGLDAWVAPVAVVSREQRGEPAERDAGERDALGADGGEEPVARVVRARQQLVDGEGDVAGLIHRATTQPRVASHLAA